MPIPHFAEANHALVLSLKSYSDQELIVNHRQDPQQARFFVALFCRYSSISYSILQHVAASQDQIDYLFACAWQRIFHRIEQLADSKLDQIVWQNWIVNIAGELVSEAPLAENNHIQYQLEAVSPPLRCYVERSLELMPPLLRLVLMMAERWEWPSSKIASQLREEGEEITEMDIPLYISESKKAFQKNLPKDLLDIYQTSNSIFAEASLDIDTLGNIVSKKSAPISP